MVKLTNNEIYDKTIDYLFNFDNTSETLNLKMVKLLFQTFGFSEPSDNIIDILKKEYETNSLTKNNLKIKDQNEELSDDYIKNNLSIFFDDNKLNIDKIYNDIKKIDNTINKSIFKEYISEDIYNNSSDYDINTFNNYILNQLKQ